MPLNAQGIYYADTSTPMSIVDITTAMATSISNQLISSNVSYSSTVVLSGITLGNGTVIAKYSRMGDIILDEILITFGTTTAVTGDVTISSLPISADTSNANFAIGSGVIIQGGVQWPVHVRTVSATSIGVRAINVSATYATTTSLSSAIPAAYGTGDRIFISTQRIAA